MLPERINPCDYQKLRERRKSLEFPGFIGLMFPILGDEPAPPALAEECANDGADKGGNRSS